MLIVCSQWVKGYLRGTGKRSHRHSFGHGVTRSGDAVSPEMGEQTRPDAWWRPSGTGTTQAPSWSRHGCVESNRVPDRKGFFAEGGASGHAALWMVGASSRYLAAAVSRLNSLAAFSRPILTRSGSLMGQLSNQVAASSALS